MEEGRKACRGNDFPTTKAGVSVADLCRKHGVSDATVYKWKAKYGGMDVSEASSVAPLVRATVAARLKGLEDENARAKRLLADAMLDRALSRHWFKVMAIPRSGKRSRIWWQVTR